MDLYKGMDQLRGLSELYRQMNNPPAPEGEDVQEGDFWHPDPDKDKKLGGPGPNQRAREDRADAAKAAAKKKDDNKLRPGESYYDYAKRKRAQKEEVENVEEGKFTASKSHIQRDGTASAPARTAAERKKDRRILAGYGKGGMQDAVARAKKERDERRASRMNAEEFIGKEVEVEEGYKEIDKAKENKMYRRAGNLARTALSSRGQKKQSAMDKSSKIVSAISRQKENERFAKMGDEKARSNYKEEKDPFGRPGGKHGGVGKPGGGYDRAIKANQKELDKEARGEEPATAKRYAEMRKKKVDEATYPSDFINPDGSKRAVAKKKTGRPIQHDQPTSGGRRKTVDESDNFTLIADFLISEGQVQDYQEAIEFLTGAPEEFIESVLKFAEERQLFMNYVVETGHCADLDEAAIVYAESDEGLIRDVIDSITE